MGAVLMVNGWAGYSHPVGGIPWPVALPCAAAWVRLMVALEKACKRSADRLRGGVLSPLGGQLSRREPCAYAD
jgi:hypothetical protein